MMYSTVMPDTPHAYPGIWGCFVVHTRLCLLAKGPYVGLTAGSCCPSYHAAEDANLVTPQCANFTQ